MRPGVLTVDFLDTTSVLRDWRVGEGFSFSMTRPRDDDLERERLGVFFGVVLEARLLERDLERDFDRDLDRDFSCFFVTD